MKFKCISRHLEKYRGGINVYRLSREIEYEKSIALDISDMGIIKAMLHRLLIEESSKYYRSGYRRHIKATRKTKYITVTCDGDVDGSEYNIFPSNRWGRTLDRDVLCEPDMTCCAANIDMFVEIYLESLETGMSGRSVSHEREAKAKRQAYRMRRLAMRDDVDGY